MSFPPADAGGVWTGKQSPSTYINGFAAKMSQIGTKKDFYKGETIRVLTNDYKKEGVFFYLYHVQNFK